MAADRMAVNDALTALVQQFGRTLTEADDDALNDLTHTVADFIDRTYVLAEPNTLGTTTPEVSEPCPQCRGTASHKPDCGLRHTWEF